MARHIRERAGRAAQFTARWMLAMGAGILCGQGALAQSGAFPVKPVRLIVPVVPGGGSDSLARMTAARVGERLGQTFIVENIAGASGLIAVQTVIKAAPDAHTLSINSSSSYNATLLSGKLEGDGRKLLAPVAQLTSQPQIMAVNVSLPIHNLQDLIAYWKKNPDGLNFASSGNGTAAHLVGELVNLNTGVKMVHVPYKGIGPGIADMISGRLQVAFTSPGAIGPHARAGKARLVMVTTPRRSAGLPDVPTAAELGFKGIEWTGWFGILTTAGSPRPSILALNAAFNQALTAPEVQKMLASDGADPAPGTPEQFGETLNNALNVAARVIKELGIKIE